MKSIAVIGAGIAGLTCARGLVRSGADVKVYDRGRGPGGRASTRRDGTHRFEHGAPFFQAAQREFMAQVAEWVEDGHARPALPRLVHLNRGRVSAELDNGGLFTGAPALNRLVRHLATDLDLVSGVRVEQLVRRSAWSEAPRWQLVVDGRLAADVFDTVVIAAPPSEAISLLQDAPHWQRRLLGVVMDPCLTAMVTFAEPLAVDWDGARVTASPLEWIHRQTGAGGTGIAEGPGGAGVAGGPGDAEETGDGAAPGESWVLHATAAYSREHLRDDPQATAWDLVRRLAEEVDRPLPAVQFVRGHRWRYARTHRPLGADHLHDESLGLAVCGDWCRGEGLEDAYVSGAALAKEIVARARAAADGGISDPPRRQDIAS
ncbi:MAG: FAD-dependent oxidoreductase [Candidatus Krumholzibacteriia bacterium]